MIGLFHGVAFPCMHAAWSVWAPPLERTQLVSAHVSGAPAGTCIIFPLGGLLAATYGWPAVSKFVESTHYCNQ
jgi:ACS family sodium-dependent inorganic phosphate cotransporter